MTGAELVGLAEQAAAQGRWAILTFHGVNDGHLHVASGDLEELCDYLARNRERIWNAPVATIAKSMAEYQNNFNGRLIPGPRPRNLQGFRFQVRRPWVRLKEEDTLNRFAGKVALITGSGRGIGQECVISGARGRRYCGQ